MKFELDEDGAALQDLAKKFAQNTMTPVVPQFDSSGDFPQEVIKSAYDMGLINLLQPDYCGGGGFSLVHSCAIVEELSVACAGMATSMVANDLALLPIMVGGTKEQHEKFIKPIIAAKELASFCLTEPGAGSDAAGVQTTITEDGDSYIVNGSKQWITNGGYASQYTVFGTTDRNLRHKGISCIVVPANAEGIEKGHHEDKMGQRCSNTVALSFNNVRVPKENLIGDLGKGFSIAMKTLDLSRPITAMIAVGIGRAAIEHAIGYAKERKQFGKAIASFQAIQFMLADMATEIEASRLLTYKSAALLDAKKKASLESSMAKRLAADSAMKAATDAVQIFGGYGYVKEYPVEKLMRDAKLMQIYEGTSQIQRIVIAKDLLS